MSSLLPHHRARTPAKQAVHLPSIDSWSSPYGTDQLPPLSFSPMRESSPPLSPHSSVGGRYAGYAYIRSSPRLNPTGLNRQDYHEEATWDRHYHHHHHGQHSDLNLPRKAYALPSIRSVFKEDRERYYTSEFEASEGEAMDIDMSPNSDNDPLDRLVPLAQPTSSSTASSMFDSEEEQEQEEDDGEGWSFTDTSFRATVFRTSAERGQWRGETILPYQKRSLLLQMRKSVPTTSAASTSQQSSSLGLGAIGLGPRRISEPAMPTAQDTFLLDTPIDPSDEKESALGIAPLADSESKRRSVQERSSSPAGEERLPPSSPLPALTPELPTFSLPESDATEPPASSEPSFDSFSPSSDDPAEDTVTEMETETAETTPLKTPTSLLADVSFVDGDVDVDVVETAEDLAIGVVEEEPRMSLLPPSSPLPPSSLPVSPLVSQLALQDEIEYEVKQEQLQELEIEHIQEQQLDQEKLSPVLSLRSLSPLSFAPSSPIPSSPLSVISSVDDADMLDSEGSGDGAGFDLDAANVNDEAREPTSAGLGQEKEKEALVPSPVVEKAMEREEVVPAVSAIVAATIASESEPTVSTSHATSAVKSDDASQVKEKKSKPKPKAKRKNEEYGEEQSQVKKKRKIAVEPHIAEKENEREKESAVKKGKKKAVDPSKNLDEEIATKVSDAEGKKRSRDSSDTEDDPSSKPEPKSKSKKQKRSSAPTSSPRTIRPSASTITLTPEEKEIEGLLIESLALSRASSMTISVLYKQCVQTKPGMKDEKTQKEWGGVFERVLEVGWAEGRGVFGKVESSGKDDSERPLEARWFYVPEQDPDQERASLLRSMMPRPGKRSETKKYKQYYWRPLDKITRWDPEDDL